MIHSFRVLVLTDHRGHSDQNSIYSILREMRIHDQCASIAIASRGLTINNDFFNNHNKFALHASQVDDQFLYTLEGYSFTKSLSNISYLNVDILFLRLPRPISDAFLIWIADTFDHSIIINDPIGIITTSSKSFLLNFPELCPPMKLCKSIKDVINFAQNHRIVLKPLREYGGRGLIKINGSETDNGYKLYDTMTYLKSIEQELVSTGYLAMYFLKNVNQGDKRIIVVGGEIVATSLRLPAEGSWLCNVAQGGRSVASKPSQEEIAIIRQVSPILLERGIFIFGADTLVGDEGLRLLSELNTLSIGGFPQAQKQTGRPIIKLTIQKMFDYATARSTTN